MKWHREYPRPVCWFAISPEYTTGGGAYHDDPPETGCDFLYVYARSAHRAKVLAIRAWRRGWWKGLWTRQRRVCREEPYICRYNDENPMAKIEIRRYMVAGPVDRRFA